MLFKIILDKKKKKKKWSKSICWAALFLCCEFNNETNIWNINYLDLISFTTIFSLYCVDKSGFYRHNDGITFLFLMFFVPSTIIKLLQNFSDKFTLQFTAWKASVLEVFPAIIFREIHRSQNMCSLWLLFSRTRAELSNCIYTKIRVRKNLYSGLFYAVMNEITTLHSWILA